MKITKNDKKTIIHLSKNLIKELNNKIFEIIDDSVLTNPYNIDKIIISIKNTKFEFEIDLNKNKKELLNVEQIIHTINKK